MLKKDEKVVSVQCGATFSLGLTNKGNCVSWGWGAGGVLGRGKGIISPEPSYLYSLGCHTGEDRIVELLAVGTTQVCCSTIVERNQWASEHYASLLEGMLTTTIID